ncbi:MAG TPA: tetratricopeptide repeat protein [Acidisarcina sp.]
MAGIEVTGNVDKWFSPKQVMISLALITICFWILEGQWCLWRTVLIVGLSFGSFTVGGLAGFLFTSYGEEAATVGKVRDWLIGGLTGLTIAKFGSIKALLLTFASGPGPKEFALTVCVAITYAGIGFFFMFFQRELILNVLLAEGRAERGRVEGTKQAGLVAQKMLAVLPPSVLSGVDDIDELVNAHKPEAENLRKLLYSDDIAGFLRQSEEAAKSGSSLDWDVVSKAAILHYYRTYYEKDGDKEVQEEKAAEWLIRALIMNPLHPDLTAKYADVLGMKRLYSETVAVLERLIESPQAPAYVEQWLGYFLLFMPDREDDAIAYSERYHQRFPDESDSLFNAASGYAQKYCKELQMGKTSDSANRSKALDLLQKALTGEPDYAETVRTEWIKPDESFACFASDQDFKKLVGLEDAKRDIAPTPSSTTDIS